MNVYMECDRGSKRGEERMGGMGEEDRERKREREVRERDRPGGKGEG